MGDGERESNRERASERERKERKEEKKTKNTRERYKLNSEVIATHMPFQPK